MSWTAVPSQGPSHRLFPFANRITLLSLIKYNTTRYTSADDHSHSEQPADIAAEVGDPAPDTRAHPCQIDLFGEFSDRLATTACPLVGV